MDSDYPSFSLRMLNAIIAMCRGDVTMPDLLRRLGYCDHYIELEFGGSNGAVRPEIITCSEDQGHSILWEWKKGGHVDRDQIVRYAGVEPKHLRTGALVPASACGASDVALVVPEAKGDDAERVLAEMALAFPVVGRGDAHLRLSHNRFAVTELNEGFSAPLVVDFAHQPLSYVPFDQESPDWAVAGPVAQCILGYLLDGRPRFTILEVAEQTVGAWSSLANAMKNRYKDRLVDLLREMEAHELSPYIRHNRARKAHLSLPTWDLVRRSASSGAQWQVRLARDFGKHSTLLINRLRAAGSAAEAESRQLTLGDL